MRAAILVLLWGCAHAQPPPVAAPQPEPPTFRDCYERCTMECDGDDCHGAGKRPVGVLLKNDSYACQCGDFDA